ncbi:MAG: hypothetical protein LBE37_03240 [Sphingobacterium sp.]|nr:hypothetical protein [Sphingobacterium sp.]
MKSQVLDTQRTISPLATTKDIRSQIKNRQELLNWIFSTSPIAGNTTNSSAMQSRLVSTTTTSANVKLASDQPMEERKIEVAKDVPKVSNQGQ